LKRRVERKGACEITELPKKTTATVAAGAVTVNAVLPGNILTEGVIAFGQEYINTMAATIPLQRLGAVEDVGNAVAFLASGEAGFITGQTVVVDGGQTLPESLQAMPGG
jgi:3-oxoacyl-[acyl-carrier protein] reductase